MYVKQNVADALVKHFNAELYSWYLYLAMGSHFENRNFLGIANWLKIQAQEEMQHAMKFYDYLNQVGVEVSFNAIDAPPKTWDSVVAVFEEVYSHEVKVTEAINNLVDLAVSEKDHATNGFLQWFVSEQVEEMASTDYILQRAKYIGENHNGLLMLDKELGKRAIA